MWLAVDGEPVLDFARMQLTGLHNAANALARWRCARRLAWPPAGRPVRVQRGWHISGACLAASGRGLYDDSKGTNVGATEAALNGMTRPVVLIAGGDGKGPGFSPWPRPWRALPARCVIGRDARRIAAALAAWNVPVQRVDTLEEATSLAWMRVAQPGDVVLLSPPAPA